MALVVSDKVLLRLQSATYVPGVNARLNPQPPLFGVVVAVSNGDVVVLTEDGRVVPSSGDLPITLYDKVAAPAAGTVTAWLDKIVLPIGFSQEYTARVVDIYQTLDSGTGIFIANFLLLRTLKSPMFYTVRLTDDTDTDPEILSDR